MFFFSSPTRFPLSIHGKERHQLYSVGNVRQSQVCSNHFIIDFYSYSKIQTLFFTPLRNSQKLRTILSCFVHPIFSSFGFWYFGHFSCVIFFPVFFRLAHLALQNVNKDYVIFSYCYNFISKSDQKPKTKNGMNESQVSAYFEVAFLWHKS